MVSIDQNISSDDDWQQFEIHFDQVHGDFSKRLKDKYPNLSPQERRLCADLRMNMTTKEIANLLNHGPWCRDQSLPITQKTWTIQGYQSC